MRVTYERRQRVIVVAISGEIVRASGNQLRRDLLRFVEDDAIDGLVINLEGVDVMDSLALGALVSTRTVAAVYRKRVAVVGVNATLRRVFTITRLHDAFIEFSCEENAAEYASKPLERRHDGEIVDPAVALLVSQFIFALTSETSRPCLKVK